MNLRFEDRIQTVAGATFAIPHVLAPVAGRPAMLWKRFTELAADHRTQN